MHVNYTLTPADRQALTILMEECGEVVQVAAKILRYGLTSDSLGKYPHTNQEQLEEELGDVAAIVRVLSHMGVVHSSEITEFARLKLERLRQHPERRPDIPDSAIPLTF